MKPGASSLATRAPNRQPQSDADARARVEKIARVYGLRKARDHSGEFHSCYRGKCPVHGGKSGTSFSIAISDCSAAILLNCFAHCSYRELYETLADYLPDKRFEMPDTIRRAREAVSEIQWRGKGGLTREDVLKTHLGIAEGCCADEYFAADRSIAEEVKTDRRTVGRAHKWLIEVGVLKRLSQGKGKTASLWQLRSPSEWTNAGGSKRPIPVQSTSVLRMGHFDPPPASMSHAEIFRFGALGKTAGRIFGAVLAWGPIGATELARQLGYKDRYGIKAPLRRLERYGLVARYGGKWWFGEKDEFQVALDLDRMGTTAAQVRRHDEQREAYRILGAIDSGKVRMSETGDLFDIATGEVVRDGRGERLRRFAQPRENAAPGGYVVVPGGTADEMRSAFQAALDALLK